MENKDYELEKIDLSPEIKLKAMNALNIFAKTCHLNQMSDEMILMGSMNLFIQTLQILGVSKESVLRITESASLAINEIMGDVKVATWDDEN